MGKNKTKKPEGAAEPVTEEAMFLQRAHELKDKGNTHFANRQHVQALACYAQALRVAPEGHPDRALFHSNRAACYLRDGLYAEVIHECNEALGVNPKFGKALLRRAKAFELKGDVNRALSDCRELTQFEPASEEAKAEIARLEGLLKNTTKKQRAKQRAQLVAQTQAAALQNMSNAQNLQKRPVQPLTLKINMGSDTRLVQVAGTLPFAELMSTIRRKFPEETGHLQLKYKDRDNQLITITNRQDLLAAVATQVRAWQVAQQAQAAKAGPAGLGGGLGKPPQGPPSVQLELCRVEAEAEEVVEFDDWLLDFAELFREHLGIDADGHVDLHNEGLEKCNLALEAAVGSEAAVPLFEQAAAKFQEVAALALLNWGNVHMCQARRLFDSNGTGDDKDKEKKEEKVVTVTPEARAQAEEHYFQAEEKYKKALELKADFYEAVIASGQQLFERAKLLSSAAADAAAKKKCEPDVEALFEQAQAKLQEALTLIPEGAAVEGAAPAAEDKGEKKEGEAKKEGENAAAPDDMLVRSQVLVMWGNVLYEQSQVRAQGGKKWAELLDQAVAKFREAKCSEDDISGALASHAGKKAEAAAAEAAKGPSNPTLPPKKEGAKKGGKK